MGFNDIKGDFHRNFNWIGMALNELEGVVMKFLLEPITSHSNPFKSIQVHSGSLRPSKLRFIGGLDWIGTDLNGLE